MGKGLGECVLSFTHTVALSPAPRLLVITHGLALGAVVAFFVKP